MSQESRRTIFGKRAAMASMMCLVIGIIALTSGVAMRPPAEVAVFPGYVVRVPTAFAGWWQLLVVPFASWLAASTVATGSLREGDDDDIESLYGYAISMCFGVFGGAGACIDPTTGLCAASGLACGVTVGMGKFFLRGVRGFEPAVRAAFTATVLHSSFVMAVIGIVPAAVLMVTGTIGCIGFFMIAEYIWIRVKTLEYSLRVLGRFFGSKK